MTASPPILDEATKSDALKIAEMALVEDIGSSDLKSATDCTTLSLIGDEVIAKATMASRDAGTMAGLQLLPVFLEKFSPQLTITPLVDDGDTIVAGQPIASLSGPAQLILMMERTCLNFVCRLAAVATLTAEYVSRIGDTGAVVLDTRKTTPAWRRLEKYAVRCGGAANHRMGLYDAVMIKDNHLAMYGSMIGNAKLSVEQAVAMAKTWIKKNANNLPHGADTVVTIEVDTLEQLRSALPADPTIVLLDNMNHAQLRKAVEIRDQLNPNVLLEASGGVNLQTIADIAQSGVDRISVGALTHSATNFDIGLDWDLSD